MLIVIAFTFLPMHNHPHPLASLWLCWQVYESRVWHCCAVFSKLGKQYLIAHCKRMFVGQNFCKVFKSSAFNHGKIIQNSKLQCHAIPPGFLSRSPLSLAFLCLMALAVSLVPKQSSPMPLMQFHFSRWIISC